MAVKIVYDGRVLGTTYNAIFAATAGMQNVSSTNNINMSMPSDVTGIKYLTLEGDGMNLTDDTIPFFDRRTDAGKAYYVSNAVSGADGTFETPPTITITWAGESQSASGITLGWWQDYCSAFNISYYDGNSLLFSVDYTNDKMTGFFSKAVEGFDKVVITFTKTAEPYRFVKLGHISFGQLNEFTPDEIYTWSAIDEIDMISEDLPAAQLEFSVQSEDELLFQDNEAIELYNGSDLLGTYYVSSSKAEGPNRYSVSAYDESYFLDDSVYKGFVGGREILEPSITPAAYAAACPTVSISVDSALSGVSLYGFLPYESVRKSMCRVAMGSNAIIRKNESGQFTLRQRATSVTSSITDDRIIGDATFEKSEPYNTIKSSCAMYDVAGADAEYKQFVSENRVSDNDLLVFDSPVEWLFKNGTMVDYPSTDANIKEWYKTYAVVTGTGFKLEGRLYAESNTDISIDRAEKLKNGVTKELKNVTAWGYSTDSRPTSYNLITKLASYLFSVTGTVKATIVWNGERCGDLVEIETKYSGTKKGYIKSLSLSGVNTLVADIEIECVKGVV